MNPTRQQSSDGRQVFSRQPARILLVDLSWPLDADTAKSIQDALDQLFVLVCSLNGPARLHLFGLLAISEHAQVLFPVQNVRTNFVQLQHAIQRLEALRADMLITTVPSGGQLKEAVDMATSMFSRQAQAFLQTAGFWCQLEIYVLTCHSIESMAQQMHASIADLRVNMVKKVQLVSISNAEQLASLCTSLSDDGSNGSQTSHTTMTATDQHSTSRPELAGLLDFITINNEVFSLRNFFTGWLHDSGTDKEHLHLSLPAADLDTEPLKLYCDIHERLISPSQLPAFQNQFNLSTECQLQNSKCSSKAQLLQSGNAAAAAAGSSSSNNLVVPVHQIRIVQRLAIDSICASVVFGAPLLVYATSCWKIDWDELERNRQSFHALCHTLQQQNEVLLASIISEQPTASRSATAQSRNSFSYTTPLPCPPAGHFVLMPCHRTSVLLMKPIAVSELVLPWQPGSAEEDPLDESIRLVHKSLQKLPLLTAYNPLMTSSGLIDALKANLISQSTNRPRPCTQRLSIKHRSTDGQVIGRDSMEVDRQSTSRQQLRYLSAKDVYGKKTKDSFPTEL